VFEDMTRLIGQAPIERYGMTETLITVSTRADGERRPGWVGVPIEGIESRLVDEAGGVLRYDGETIGELQIRGATMFDEYLNRPDATAASLDGEWFRTGDAAVIDDAGFHRIVGRQSIDIIKTGGFKVGAGEVEAALLTHPGVTEAAVIGVSDPDLGQKIVAFVVCSDVDDTTLINHVAALLSVHKRPREVRVVEVLPRNAMGKVQKTLLS
jgi:fatty acid CoA ligase FadD36